MTEKVYNNNNLRVEEINETVNRVKILLVNSKEELLLGYCNGVYQFIGGHVEDGETFIDCIVRETKEETGISLQLKDVEPFFAIKHLNKNYPREGINRLSGIYYFVINTDQKPNYDEIEYTESEKKGDFKLVYVSLDNIEEVLKSNIERNKKNEIIVPEMIAAIEEYKLNKTI